MMRRVLVLVPQPLGGVGRLFSSLIDPDADGFSENYEVKTLQTHRGRYSTLEGRLKSSVALPFVLMYFFYLLSRRRVDICHINLSVHGSTYRKLVFAKLCRLFGIKYILHLHSGRYPDFYKELPKTLKTLISRMFRDAERIVVLGNVWKKYVVSELGQSPDRVFILPNAVKGPVHFREHASAKTVRLLFLGRVWKAKGIEELIEALSSEHLQALHWDLVIAGDGDIEHYRLRVDQLGLGDRVHFTGWMDEASVTTLLESSDVLVLPSHVENLPLSLLEGMAFGLCPISTPVGAIPDVIIDGENGLIVPVGNANALADAIACIVEDDALRVRLATAARRTYEKSYRIENYAGKLEALYDGLLPDEEKT